MPTTVSEPQIMRRHDDLPNPPKHLPATRLRIAETFVSRQGEGRLTGQTSFFIRTSGCNLRCWFCDTPYASWHPEGDTVAIDQLVAAAVAADCGHVVLTGGEPLLPRGVTELVAQLRAASLHVTIETAGTVLRDCPADLMSISPKLAGSGPRTIRRGDPVGDPREPADAQDTAVSALSRLAQRHEAARWRPDVIRGLIDLAVEHQLKFVVDSPADFADVLAAIEAICRTDESRAGSGHGPDPAAVWIMPQAIDTNALDEKSRWLRPLCDRHGFRYCDRMQIRWYGDRRGT